MSLLLMCINQTVCHFLLNHSRIYFFLNINSSSKEWVSILQLVVHVSSFQSSGLAVQINT
jgi:hypothetical protein